VEKKRGIGLGGGGRFCPLAWPACIVVVASSAWRCLSRCEWLLVLAGRVLVFLLGFFSVFFSFNGYEILCATISLLLFSSAFGFGFGLLAYWLVSVRRALLVLGTYTTASLRAAGLGRRSQATAAAISPLFYYFFQRFLAFAALSGSCCSYCLAERFASSAPESEKRFM